MDHRPRACLSWRIVIRPWRAFAFALACIGSPVTAQQVTPPAQPVNLWSSVISSAAAGVVALSPALLHINERAPECAPCDPAALPSFDRWAVRLPSSGWSLASDAALTGIGLATLLDMSRKDNGLRRAAASTEAAAWALALSQVTKAVVGRKRPILYTTMAAEEANAVGARRSFPSGHTAVAFAVAISYWLDGKDRRRPAHWVVLGGAVFVGVSRVAAAQHFPSDVFAGAILGSTTALLVHEIRF